MKRYVERDLQSLCLVFILILLGSIFSKVFEHWLTKRAVESLSNLAAHILFENNWLSESKSAIVSDIEMRDLVAIVDHLIHESILV